MKIVLFSLAGIAITAAFIYWLAWPGAAKIVFTEDELNAGAAEAALEYYMKEWARPGRTREDAEAALAVDGYHNILSQARAYNKRYGGGSMKTVYEVWAERAPAICLRHKLAGEPIVMPSYGPPPGYHIVRSDTGSAAMVKDGEPAPQFGCAPGFHYAGFPAQPDGSGGCQPNK
jgi:hypothetical protein